MASIQHTQPIHVPPRPVSSERARRQRRHRLLKAVILLTVPLYCVGFTLLAVLRVEEIVNRAASSPLFLGGLVFFAFLLLIEPWTGAVTHSCAAGVKCASVGAADPVSCLGCLGSCMTVVGVGAGIVALASWLL
ncbi:MAG: hypothetical protein ACE5HA_18705 [Anaerolineae bacterium]